VAVIPLGSQFALQLRGIGQTGIINIERESNLSGRFHDKGVHIIAGYLRSLFAQDKPLSLAASICFEQSYSSGWRRRGSTEIYALASALSGILRQDIAVTGSMTSGGYSGDWHQRKDRGFRRVPDKGIDERAC
jgi:predicted ATP-dependent protease